MGSLTLSIRARQARLRALGLSVCLALPTAGFPASVTLPDAMRCIALQTAGLHDYAGLPEHYEPSTFFESKFELQINQVLTQHLASDPVGAVPSPSNAAAAAPDLYLTMLPRNDQPIELRCRQIRGSTTQYGFSCVNTPPSEMLLINAENRRFTRTSIGGWTFTGPAGGVDADAEAESDDSLFVEYGHCEPRPN